MQRRVEQADGDRQAVHGLEDLHEVGLLGHPQRLEGRLLLGRRVGQDHPADDGQPVLGQEHVLGPAQADPLGPEAAGVGGVGPVVGVGPHPEVAGPDLVGPAEDGVELRAASRPGSPATWPSTTVPLVPSTEIQSPS